MTPPQSACSLSPSQLVLKHFRAAADIHGDTAHLGPAFATYHRAFTLLFETALLAVGRERNVTALPYWVSTLPYLTLPYLTGGYPLAHLPTCGPSWGVVAAAATLCRLPRF